MHQEELIEAVRKLPLLYDTNDLSYMKSKLKDDIWNKIAKEVRLKNGSEAKQMWLKLRGCHREALRRQKNTFKSGSATGIKPWRYQKQMDFLVPYMGNRPREGNLELESEEEQTQDLSQNADSDTSVHENANTENLSAEGNTETEHLLNENTVSNSDTSKSMSETIVQKNTRMKKDDIASIMKESMIRREKRAEELAIERKKASEEEAVKPQRGDGLQNFFLAMYEIAKEMPATYQHIIRNGVYQAVSEVEAKYLQIGTSSQQNFSQTGPQTPILHQLQPIPQRAYSPSTSYSHASYSSFTSTPLQSPSTEAPGTVSAQSEDTASFFQNFSA